MLDKSVRRLINAPLDRLGKLLADRGASADDVTYVGLGLGLLSALLIALGWSQIALVPLVLGRIADGLDGAVARATTKTDFGGYLDIAADFLFYGAVPMAFVWADPAANGAAGAFLLTSFYFNGTTFLGYAMLADRHGMETSAQGIKSLYYSNGLLEGTETILFFASLCLYPGLFPILAWLFGGLCFLTATLRLIGARRQFSNRKDT